MMDPKEYARQLGAKVARKAFESRARDKRRLATEIHLGQDELADWIAAGIQVALEVGLERSVTLRGEIHSVEATIGISDTPAKKG